MKDYLRDTEFLSKPKSGALQRKVRDFNREQAKLITDIERHVFGIEDVHTVLELQRLNSLKINKQTTELVNFVIDHVLKNVKK